MTNFVKSTNLDIQQGFRICLRETAIAKWYCYCLLLNYTYGDLWKSVKRDEEEQVVCFSLSNLTPGQCSHFIIPENTRKPLVFWSFQGILNGDIGQKWVDKKTCHIHSCMINTSTHLVTEKLQDFICTVNIVFPRKNCKIDIRTCFLIQRFDICAKC